MTFLTGKYFKKVFSWYGEILILNLLIICLVNLYNLPNFAAAKNKILNSNLTFYFDQIQLSHYTGMYGHYISRFIDY